MKNTLDSLGDTDFKAVDIPGLFLLWVLLVVVFLQFFTRYILNNSLGWTEEAARFLLILVGFVGAILAARKHTHISLEFFYHFVPESVGNALRLICDLITFGFFAYLSYVGIKLSQATGQSMVSIPLPKSLIYWSVSAALAVIAIYAALQSIRALKCRL